VQTLDSLIFVLWSDLAKQEDKDYITQLKDFINAYGLVFLQTITDYLRKELKVPKYSEMYEDKV
jgi:cyclopropane fatty-acyl-phospholipid synthase-like methyltransferase